VKRLPRSLDEIRGLRVARWIRESTAGQYDRYGPASQREQQDRFIERHGLVDTGLVFQVAQSGTTVWRSPTMNEMLGQAKAGAFDSSLPGTRTAGSATCGGRSNCSRTTSIRPASPW
jgi:hypothetical protein